MNSFDMRLRGWGAAAMRWPLVWWTGVVVVAAAAVAAGTLTWAGPGFSPADAPVGWASRPATRAARGGEPAAVFRADYRSGLWTGTVTAESLDASVASEAAGPWSSDTATQLDAADWNSGRQVITCSEVSSSNTCRNAAFRWEEVGEAMRSRLGDAQTGPVVLNFLRGDRSNEAPQGAGLRPRASVQGDILHSPLTYWRYPDGTQRLFVGGNDGMLHVFDASTGAEVYAYVPSMLAPTLPRLARAPYVHTPYVDGGLALADVVIDGRTRTLLAGALGGGGKGLFLLDVTDSSAPGRESDLVSQAPVKWEVTSGSAGFANLGYTYASPRLARLNSGHAAVVVGNGYLAAGSGRASLMLVDAQTGAMIREIEVDASASGAAYGLSTPTLVDLDRDGKADVAYAGDLDGQLWRFDLRGPSPANYSVRLLGSAVGGSPITTAPAVFSHPAGGTMVVFGSGSTLSASSLVDSTPQWLVGIWDGAPQGNSDWLEQVLAEDGTSQTRVRTLSARAPNWSAGGHRGWRLPLPAGERLVAEGMFIAEGRLHVTTTNPTIGRASQEDRGSNWFIELDALSGGSPRASIFDVNGDGSVGADDLLNGAVVVGRWLGTGVASQPVLADTAALAQTVFNRQSDNPYLPTTSQTGPGVSGGHFDADLHARSTGSFSKPIHVHEYDDLFDVNGVNMLAPSKDTMRLSAVLAQTTAFKVLVSNQYLNPASLLKVGPGADFLPVREFGGQSAARDAQTLLDSLPVYALAAGVPGTQAIVNLAWKVPLDAFQSRDWWGDGGVPRAGLIPSETKCVHDMDDAGYATTGSVASGERHNGALTIQLIAGNTPASALRLNRSQDGDVRYGWTVREGTEFRTYVLAEYTFFWHHDNKKCYGASGWTPSPPQDTSASGKSATRAAQSSDPADGAFGGGQTQQVQSVVTKIIARVVVTTIAYTDGTVVTIRYADRSDGTEQVTTTSGQVVTTRSRGASGQTVGGPVQTRRASARVNWREVNRS